MTVQQRRLAAILAMDVVGYSRLMEADEAGTLAALGALRRDVLEPLLARQSGRLFKAMGDGFLVEFASAVQAVACAAEIQARSRAQTAGLQLRIGVHLGDVIVQGDDLMGDGVNIAARLEGIAEAGGIAISRQVHDQVQGKLELTFHDMGEVALKNLARPVHVFAVAGPAAGPPVAPALALPDKPSIAVLPFQNMSGDPEQEYFADGIVEDITTALSRFKSLFVIARNSSFTYKGKAVDIKQVGRELGVRYVLEGSVRKVGGQVRITGQLIEAASGSHLWAERFDGSLKDVFALQDQVTTSVLGAIVSRLDRAEMDRARRKPVENLDAYDLYLRGLASRNAGTPEGEDEALRLFYAAIERAPEFALAYGMAAQCYLVRLNTGRVEDRAREAAETRRLAMRVSVIGADDAQALALAGGALIYVCQDYEAGSALVDRALAINPNDVFGQRMRGWACVFTGRHEEALSAFTQSLRLSPLDPRVGAAQRGMAAAMTFLGRFDQAAAWADRALANQPNEIPTLRVCAAAQALAGNIEVARKIATRLCEEVPGIRVSRLKDHLPHRRPEDIELFAEGLRRAGVPE